MWCNLLLYVIDWEKGQPARLLQLCLYLWDLYITNKFYARMRTCRQLLLHSDLPLNFHPFGTGVRWVAVLHRTFYRRWREFSCFWSAVANAVRRATGIAVRDLPFSRHRLA